MTSLNSIQVRQAYKWTVELWASRKQLNGGLFTPIKMQKYKNILKYKKIAEFLEDKDLGPVSTVHKLVIV